MPDNSTDHRAGADSELTKAQGRRFRKKPVIVEAIKYTGTNMPEVWAFARSAIDHGGPGGIVINTSEGKMLAVSGWWIIKGVEGEFYPCSPSVFAATYEEIADNGDA